MFADYPGQRCNLSECLLLRQVPLLYRNARGRSIGKLELLLRSSAWFPVLQVDFTRHINVWAVRRASAQCEEQRTKL